MRRAGAGAIYSARTSRRTALHCAAHCCRVRTPSTPCEYSEYPSEYSESPVSTPSTPPAHLEEVVLRGPLLREHLHLHVLVVPAGYSRVLTGVLTGILWRYSQGYSQGYSEYSRLARLLRVLVDLGDPVAAVAGGRRAALVLDDLQVERLSGKEECETNTDANSHTN
jgi:hypothetical protein